MRLAGRWGLTRTRLFRTEQQREGNCSGFGSPTNRCMGWARQYQIFACPGTGYRSALSIFGHGRGATAEPVPPRSMPRRILGLGGWSRAIPSDPDLADTVLGGQLGISKTTWSVPNGITPCGDTSPPARLHGRPQRDDTRFPRPLAPTGSLPPNAGWSGRYYNDTLQVHVGKIDTVPSAAPRLQWRCLVANYFGMAVTGAAKVAVLSGCVGGAELLPLRDARRERDLGGAANVGLDLRQHHEVAV